MHRIVAVEGVYFRVGVAVVPAAPRFYRERRCLPCSWVKAVGHLAWCLLLTALCHARRGVMRAYLRALLSDVVPAGALPVLARVVWWTPPLPRLRFSVGVLLIELVLLVAALT